MSKKFFTRSFTALLSTVMAVECGLFSMPQEAFAIDGETSYAVYSDGDIIVNTENGVFNGNVYSGDDFNYLGSNICYVNKTLNADHVSDKVQAIEKTDMRASKPDYTNALSTKVKYRDERSEDTALKGGVYSLNGSLNVDGSLYINRTVLSGKGYVTAKGDIKYNAVQNEEGTEMFLSSTDGNITIMGSDLVMTGVIYAPEGKVEINAKNFIFNGTIIAESIELNGTDITVNERSSDENTLLQFNPELEVKGIKDTYKENRKITLDISESFGLGDVNEDTLTWEFEPVSGSAYDAVKIDETASTPLHRELIISKEGAYNVKIKGTDKDGVPFVFTDVLNITKDLPPVADFWKEVEVTGRDSEGKAEIKLEDTSYSPDGDEIGSRVWSVFFDSDNDGDFSDEEEKVFSVGNETKVTFTADSVGKYKFNLHAAEVFTDTIKSLISDDAYLVADSNSNGENSSKPVVEVTNEAPKSHSGISRAKNVDIVITAGNTDIDEINTLNRNIEEVKKELEAKGFSVNLSTLSTSTLTAKDTFAWKEYDHYNYKDQYLPTLEKHITFDDNSIKMVGYSVSPLRDWLFVDDGINAKRVLSFDMVRDKTDWHSMEGGGFLFNTSIKKKKVEKGEGEEPVEKEFMDGYCMILTSGGFKLVQLTDVDVEEFRNGGLGNTVQSIGKVLTTVRVPDVYADYNIKIVATNRLVSVYINDERLIDNFILPDNEVGTGFGPIICHDYHGCSQQSYFTFSNIKMSTVHGSELSDVLNDQEWRKSSERFVVNLSKESLYDLNDDASVGHAVKSLIENDANFVGIGTVESKDEYQAIFNSANGTYIDWYDILKDKDILKNYFLNTLSKKDYSVDGMITTSDEIVYDNYYDDKENDPVGEQKWTYDLDASVYENSTRETGVFTSDVPMTYLDATGVYKITSLLMDDPTNNNNNLDSYKKWSNEVEWTDGLNVHSKPVAEITSSVSKTDDKNKYVCELSFNAYDNDALSKENKGITKEIREWKRVNDSEWMQGTIPKIIDAEQVYLQKYAVCDEQGEWSNTAIALVYAEKTENENVFSDDQKPVVKISVSDNNPCLNDQILITVTAEDDTEVAYVKTTVDGRVMSNYQGSFLYECKKQGTIEIKAVAEDIGHNQAEQTYEINVEDRRDLISPEITIDTKTDITIDGTTVNVNGSVTDNVKLDNYTAELKAPDESEFTKIFTSSDEVKNGNIVLFDTNGKTGKFSLKLTAVDTSGNTRFATMDINISEDESYKANKSTSEQKAKPESRTDTPAEITIAPSKDTAEIGELVNITIDADDPDGLTSVKVYKDNKLVGEGVGEFRFSEAEAKTVTIKVETTDSFGKRTTETKEIVFTDTADRTAPTAVITSPENNSEVSGKVSIVGSAYDEDGMRNYKLEYKADKAASYKLIESSLNERNNAELGVWDTYTLDNGVYYVKLSVTDNGGNITETTVQYTVKNGAETPAEQVNEELIVFSKPEPSVTADAAIKVEAAANSTLNGAEYEVSVRRADGNGGQQILKTGKLDGNGAISASVDSSMFEEGKYIVSIAVKPAEGEAVKKESTVTVKHDLVKADEEMVCRIVSPEGSAEISAPTEVKAEVTDNVFSKYKLEYAPAGTADYTVFDSGSVDGKEIKGKLDPTLMENGFFDIRLTAYGDKIMAQDTVTVEVAGNMKIGNFTLSFADLEFDAEGIPVTMIRTYDSRRKDTKGEFGYGWSLAYDNIKMSISADQSDHWTEDRSSSFFITKFNIHETKDHKVSIDLGNGVKEEFIMNISPASQVLIPQHLDLSVSYTPVDKTGSTLVPCDMSPNGIIYDGGRLLNSDFDEYDPQRFIYTRADGSKYVLDAKLGLISVTSASGNTVSFGKNGVTSSDGKAIKFAYDKDGRLAEASDSTGKKVTYEYDIFGDLVSVTDHTGSKTEFKYKKHYITEIYDARGVMISKNEYDNDGRLIKTTDPEGNEIVYEHDIEGREEAITDRTGAVTRYIYDDRGNILSQTDANGKTVKNTYDSNGYLATKTDAMGFVTSYKYDSLGNMLSLTDAEGREVTNEYDSKGMLTSISTSGMTVLKIDYTDDGLTSGTTDAMGNQINYEYDSKKRLKSVTDEIGTYMNMTYDSSGNVKTATNGAGATAEFNYDADGNCISKTVNYTSDGAVKTVTENYVYDDKGHLIKTIDSQGNIVSNEYNDIDKISVATDEKGRQTSYEYDKMGNLTKIKYYDGTSESFTYDKEGRNTTAVDRLGRKVTMTYDKVGNLLTKTYPNEKTVEYAYDDNYRLVSTTDTRGAVTSYEYDKTGNNTAVINALDERTSFACNERGQLASMTDARGYTYSYSYDDNGNRTKTTYPDGTFVSSKYDARGRVTSQTDQHGYVTSYTYDGADNLTAVTDALGKTTSYDYDERNNLVKVTDANGHETKYTYDEFGRVVKTTNALGLTAEATYDISGNILTSTDFAGKLTSFEYDKYDRLIRKKNDDGTVSYSYSNDGKLLSVSDNKGTTRYTYNKMDGLTKVDYPGGMFIEYSYDDTEVLTGINTNFGSTSYNYDSLGRLTRVVDRNGYATQYEYDKNGNRTAVKYANGITVTYDYDALNRLICEKALDSEGGIVAQYEYTLGEAGERTKVTELDRTVDYTYDELYRLTGETIINSDGSVNTYSYTYDDVSNRLSKNENGNVTEYTYNELNQLVQENNTVYTYDDAGNLISSDDGNKSSTYVYNASNKLLRYTSQNGNDVIVEEYSYDYDGNRITKKTDSETVYYLNDTNAEYTQVIAEYDQSGNEKCYYTLADEIISQERDSKQSYFIADGHGSIRQLSDSEGVITDTYVYDAWGNLISTTGNTVNNYLYCGEQFDSTTGLYYLRARYMDPATGTFISMDTYQGSIFEPVSLHKYLYANANPVTYSDPSGNMAAALLGGMAIGVTIDSAEAAFCMAVFYTLLAAITLIAVKVISDAVVRAATTSVLDNEFDIKRQGNLAIIFMMAQVSNVVKALKKAVEKVNEERQCYYVYMLQDSEGNVRYVGRTKNLQTRLNNHAKSGKNSNLTLYDYISNLTYEQSRALEQTLMVQYHTRNWLKEEGNNSINGVGPNNKRIPDYKGALAELFDNIADDEYLSLKEEFQIWW